jgi:hypothetical protein
VLRRMPRGGRVSAGGLPDPTRLGERVVHRDAAGFRRRAAFDEMAGPLSRGVGCEIQAANMLDVSNRDSRGSWEAPATTKPFGWISNLEAVPPPRPRPNGLAVEGDQDGRSSGISAVGETMS